MEERVGRWMVFTGGLVLFLVFGWLLLTSAGWLGAAALLSFILVVVGVALGA